MWPHSIETSLGRGGATSYEVPRSAAAAGHVTARPVTCPYGQVSTVTGRRALRPAGMLGNAAVAAFCRNRAEKTRGENPKAGVGTQSDIPRSIPCGIAGPPIPASPLPVSRPASCCSTDFCSDGIISERSPARPFPSYQQTSASILKRTRFAGQREQHSQPVLRASGKAIP